MIPAANVGDAARLDVRREVRLVAGGVVEAARIARAPHEARGELPRDRLHVDAHHLPAAPHELEIPLRLGVGLLQRVARGEEQDNGRVRRVRRVDEVAALKAALVGREGVGQRLPERPKEVREGDEDVARLALQLERPPALVQLVGELEEHARLIATAREHERERVRPVGECIHLRAPVLLAEDRPEHVDEPGEEHVVQVSR